MKVLQVFAAALILGLPVWFSAPAFAQETVTVADGTQQTIPADLVAQIEAAVSGETGVDVAEAIRDLVAANPDLTLAIVAYATAQRPAAANAIAFGAIWANPDAGDDILATTVASGGNVSQTIISFAKTGAGAQGVQGRARIVAIAEEDDGTTVDTSENPATDTAESSTSTSPTTI